MSNNREIKLSAGRVASNAYTEEKMTWDAMKERLQASREMKQGEDPKAFKLSCDAFVFGTLRREPGALEHEPRRRCADNVVNRYGLALDLEDMTPEQAEKAVGCVENMGVEYAVYSTLNHTPEAPRLRIVMPFSRYLPAHKYAPVALRVGRKINEAAGAEVVDASCANPAQSQSFPAHKEGEKPFFKASSGTREMLDPLAELAELEIEKGSAEDPRNWDWLKTEPALEGPSRKKGGPEIVQAFNKAYPTVKEALESFKFLRALYIPTDRPGVYYFTKGEATDKTGRSMQILPDDPGACWIFSAGNPIRRYAKHPEKVQVADVFRLVQFAKFNPDGIAPERLAEDTPAERVKESFRQMAAWAEHQGKVAAELKKMRKNKSQIEQEDAMRSRNEDVSETDFRNIIGQIDVDGKGNIKNTRRNIRIIIANDPRLSGPDRKIYLNEFTHRIEVKSPFPWSKDGDFISDEPKLLTDDDLAEMRVFLDDRYSTCPRDAINDAVISIAKENSRHPVKEFIESAEWDGTPRAERLFIDYLGAEDNALTREATLRWLTASVKRIYEPGAKFDHMLVLVGRPDIGKSTILRALGGPWYKDDRIDMTAKDAYQAIAATQIQEMAELAGVTYEDIDIVKSFISRQSDFFRPAYGRLPEEHRRTCVFAATTNNYNFLRDNTGERRFWPIRLKADLKTVFPAKRSWELLENRDEVQQIWAEVYQLYKSGFYEKTHGLQLSAEAKVLLNAAHFQHKLEDPETDTVVDYLTRQYPVNYRNLPAEEQADFFRTGTSLMAEPELAPLEYVCTAEIIHVAFGLRGVDKCMARRIGKILSELPGIERIGRKVVPNYGRVICYGLSDEFFANYPDVEWIQQKLIEEERDRDAFRSGKAAPETEPPEGAEQFEDWDLLFEEGEPGTTDFDEGADWMGAVS